MLHMVSIMVDVSPPVWKTISHNPLIFYLIIKVFSHRLYTIATEMMRVRHDLKPNDFLLGATIRGVK